ncbi:MAG: hypothetical protein RI910_1565 [Verrucomicrobiota bacterium]|jgi:hypothetical protein
MPDNPDRSHPAGISRRDALRGVILGAFGLVTAASSSPAQEPPAASRTDSEYVPEDNYPTFVEEPDTRPS